MLMLAPFWRTTYAYFNKTRLPTSWSTKLQYRHFISDCRTQTRKNKVHYLRRSRLLIGFMKPQEHGGPCVLACALG